VRAPRRRSACDNSSHGTRVTERDLRKKSGELLRALDRGETFIVTRDGVPVGELTPLRRRRFVAAEAAIAGFAGAPAVESKRFRADVDARLDREAGPRG
jgi:antitoxin (DNA-binding transcriptional repressor) of toxin-antitoxin stability system